MYILSVCNNHVCIWTNTADNNPKLLFFLKMTNNTIPVSGNKATICWIIRVYTSTTGQYVTFIHGPSIYVVFIRTFYRVFCTSTSVSPGKSQQNNILNIGNNTNSTNKDILYNNIQNKHTKQTYKINIQNKHTKHTYKSNIQNTHTKQTYKTIIQNKHTKQTRMRTWNKQKTKISGEMHPTQRKNRHTKQYKQQL